MVELDTCVERMLAVVSEAHAPLYMEVVKSIASICGVDPYELWYRLATSVQASSTRAPTASTQKAVQSGSTEVKALAKTVRSRASEALWRCPACGKEFSDVSKLVSHITFLLRQGDRDHRELYLKIKKCQEEKKATFTDCVKELLKE